MIEFLSSNPVLLLFTVAALGYLIGNIKFRGISLGVAAILFTGLAFGAMDPSLQIPEVILVLGLSLFIYSIGLSSGPAFFESYRKSGVKDIQFVLLMLLSSGAIAVGLFWLFGFSAAKIAGIYSGSTTNTAALAGVIDLISQNSNSVANLEDLVVGYTFSYPMGVLGSMMAILICERMFKIDYKAEQKKFKDEYPVDVGVDSISVAVTNEEMCGVSIRDLNIKHRWGVVFGRIFSDGNIKLANWDTQFVLGDVVMVVGASEALEQVVQDLGELSDSDLPFDMRHYDSRRIFLSNPMLAGRTIASLNLPSKFNAVITRIRRGDMDMVAKAHTIIEQGDRIRFIAKREDLKNLSTYFGDSYKESSTINLFSFGLGIALGLFLGSLEFSLGDQFSFKLGYAGGPLVVGLVLGALRRTGPIVWTMPYSANVTLRQIGIILLLATIGVRSGNAFIQSLSLEAFWIFIAGSIISIITAFLILFVGYKFMNKPFALLTGMVANQPAILDFSLTRANNNLPSYGYSMMLPIAIIVKILLAQLLYLLLI